MFFILDFSTFFWLRYIFNKIKLNGFGYEYVLWISIWVYHGFFNLSVFRFQVYSLQSIDSDTYLFILLYFQINSTKVSKGIFPPIFRTTHGSTWCNFVKWCGRFCTSWSSSPGWRQWSWKQFWNESTPIPWADEG